ncbi:transposase [Spiroplasma endosymbiont of Colias croceus]|uniref:transposase n=1 Tax=Spiroplasma endosymbiont of Colias croceus TaxID=3066310 RepID=UPI0030CCB21A
MANINSYTDEFKKQIVALYQSGKSVSCLAKEYNVTRAATYNWIKQFSNSGSFKTKDNRSFEENELIKLKTYSVIKFFKSQLIILKFIL